MRDKIDIGNIETDFDEPQDSTAVVLLFDGEDNTYHLKERANEIYQTTGYSSYLDMIVKLNKYKKVYESLGSSNFKDTSYQIADGLRNKLGGDYIVINSYLYTKPYFENTLEDLVSKGYKNIVICPMFITEGTDYKVFKNRLNKMELARHEVNINTTDVFYKSNTLAKGYKDEVLKNIRDKDAEVGVLLVGLNNENELEQDVLFREKIKEYILNEKKDNIQIKLPLLENNKKDI
ncbi:MAG TPA: ferrochelatase, partial [Peptostreptococcaceae bacterium]|nr:ferrochelatase [Peptostreptococcaceae bacterium]